MMTKMCINIFWTPFPESASLERQTDLAQFRDMVDIVDHTAVLHESF